MQMPLRMLWDPFCWRQDALCVLRRPDAGLMGIFGANLSLILSILWCFCNALVFQLPLLHASLHSVAAAPAPAEVRASH